MKKISIKLGEMLSLFLFDYCWSRRARIRENL